MLIRWCGMIILSRICSEPIGLTIKAVNQLGDMVSMLLNVCIDFCPLY